MSAIARTVVLAAIAAGTCGLARGQNIDLRDGFPTAYVEPAKAKPATERGPKEKIKAEKRKRSTKPLRKGAVRGSVRATVRVEGPFSLAPFELGVPLWADGDRHIWTEIPEGFEGCVFTQFDSRHQSFTEFEVRSGGYVFLAVTSRWGGGGSISANLAGEMISESAFLEEGWTKVASPGEADGDSRHGHHWVIYQRFCNKGERFRLRTEKYCAPILFF